MFVTIFDNGPNENQPFAHMFFFQLCDTTDELIGRFAELCDTYLSRHAGRTHFSVGVHALEIRRDVSGTNFEVSVHMIFDNGSAGYCLNSQGIALDLEDMNTITALDSECLQLSIGAGTRWTCVYDLLRSRFLRRVGGARSGGGIHQLHRLVVARFVEELSPQRSGGFVASEGAVEHRRLIWNSAKRRVELQHAAANKTARSQSAVPNILHFPSRNIVAC